jgi:hypothetical protein
MRLGLTVGLRVGVKVLLPVDNDEYVIDTVELGDGLDADVPVVSNV